MLSADNMVLSTDNFVLSADNAELSADNPMLSDNILSGKRNEMKNLYFRPEQSHTYINDNEYRVMEKMLLLIGRRAAKSVSSFKFGNPESSDKQNHWPIGYN
jgi:hypothetical protein